MTIDQAFSSSARRTPAPNPSARREVFDLIVLSALGLSVSLLVASMDLSSAGPGPSIDQFTALASSP